ncbi:hypothetical protein D3C87_2161690 [compost metagenome]
MARKHMAGQRVVGAQAAQRRVACIEHHEIRLLADAQARNRAARSLGAAGHGLQQHGGGDMRLGGAP